MIKLMKHRTGGCRNTAFAVLGLVFALNARAQIDDHERQARTATPPIYVQECGACHLAYPAQLLPAASWRRLLGALDRHFGSDASVDGAAAERISRWLTTNAGRHGDAAAPDDRITRSPWFVREHREVAWFGAPGEARSTSRSASRSASDCAACHAGAAQGLFDEDSAGMTR